MLLCKKVSLCKSSLKIRMGCSHDLLSVLQRGWLVPGTSVGRNINPACFFERPLWGGTQIPAGFLRASPVEREISGFRFAYLALAVGAKWHCVPAGGAKDAVRPRNGTSCPPEVRKTLCVREMVLRAHREAGNESSLAFLERPLWSGKYHDSGSLPRLSPEARNDAVRPRGAGNITIPLRLRGSRRRREGHCVPAW